MTGQEKVSGPGQPPDWLCRLAAHDGYGVRMDWLCLCPRALPADRGEPDGCREAVS